MQNIFNYIKIDDNISTSGILTKEDIELISKEGFDVVINLSVDDERSLEDENRIVGDLGMSYIHIPISWTSPRLDRLDMFCGILKILQEKNKKVFIHCMKNYRVSVFIYRYKKDILKQKDVKFISPEDYVPNKVWQRIIDLKL